MRVWLANMHTARMRTFAWDGLRHSWRSRVRAACRRLQKLSAARTDHWQGRTLAVKAGAGLAAMPHIQVVRLSLLVSSTTSDWSCPTTCSRATSNTLPECGPSPNSWRQKPSPFARFCRTAISLAPENHPVPPWPDLLHAADGVWRSRSKLHSSAPRSEASFGCIPC